MTAQPPAGHWKLARLADVSRIRYGLGQPPEADDTGIPMIGATDIKRGRIIADRVFRVSQAAVPMQRDPFLKKGDIIVVRSGAYTGDVAMYDGTWNLALAGYDLVVSPSYGQVEAPFLTYYLLGDQA